MTHSRPRRLSRLAIRAAAVLAALAGAAGAWEPVLFAAMEPGGPAVVAEVVDGDTVVLADGRQVRLVGTQAPKLPLGRPHVKQQPFAPESKATLESLVLGRAVELRFGGLRQDRHGRTLAHLVRAEDGMWVQGEMLRRGMARVYSFEDNRGAIPEMLALEAEARAAGRGIWTDPFFAVRTPDSVAGRTDGYEIVEGTVQDVARVRDVVYLNFGPDWRSDFTVEVPKSALPAFRRAGIDLFALKGRMVQVRGWVVRRNGPAIEVTHPEQVRF